MAQGNDLDELQRKYAAMDFPEATPAPKASALPWFMRDAASANTTAVTDTSQASLDEMQRQYAALGFSEAQTPSRPATMDSMAALGTPVAAASLASPSAASAGAASGAHLDEMQEQYDDLFRERPRALDTDLGGESNPAVRTPDSSSASTGAGHGVTRSAGGIDEFAMYQRFRLNMVKLFGSLSSAIFELGADPETGISRIDFVDVLCDKLQLFSRSDANSLFSHATNADVMDNGLGGVATFRDFGICEDEWRAVVSAKQETTVRKKAMPFQNGPGGVSMGIYHRTVKLEDVVGPQRSGSKGSQDLGNDQNFAATAPQAGTSAKKATRKRPLHSRPLRKEKLSNGQRVWPWRMPAKTWQPCMMGTEPFEDPSDLKLQKTRILRQRVMQNTISSPRALLYTETSMMDSEQLSTSVRTDPPVRPDCKLDQCAGHLLCSAPSARREMETAACVRNVATWWPYKSTAPAPKLRAVLPPLPAGAEPSAWQKEYSANLAMERMSRRDPANKARSALIHFQPSAKG